MSMISSISKEREEKISTLREIAESINQGIPAEDLYNAYRGKADASVFDLVEYAEKHGMDIEATVCNSELPPFIANEPVISVETSLGSYDDIGIEVLTSTGDKTLVQSGDFKNGRNFCDSFSDAIQNYEDGLSYLRENYQDILDGKEIQSKNSQYLCYIEPVQKFVEEAKHLNDSYGNVFVIETELGEAFSSKEPYIDFSMSVPNSDFSLIQTLDADTYWNDSVSQSLKTFEEDFKQYANSHPEVEWAVKYHDDLTKANEIKQDMLDFAKDNQFILHGNTEVGNTFKISYDAGNCSPVVMDVDLSKVSKDENFITVHSQSRKEDFKTADVTEAKAKFSADVNKYKSKQRSMDIDMER